MADIDPDTLNVLLAEGTDLPTALAASVRDDDPKPLPQWVLVICYAVAILVGLLVYFSI